MRDLVIGAVNARTMIGSDIAPGAGCIRRVLRAVQTDAPGQESKTIAFASIPFVFDVRRTSSTVLRVWIPPFEKQCTSTRGFLVVVIDLEIVPLFSSGAKTVLIGERAFVDGK